MVDDTITQMAAAIVAGLSHEDRDAMLPLASEIARLQYAARIRPLGANILKLSEGDYPHPLLGAYQEGEIIQTHFGLARVLAFIAEAKQVTVEYFQ